jgi:hypothetical protein
MVTIPLEGCILVPTIHGNLSIISPGIGIECVVVDIGEFYYRHNTKAIEERTTKRKI